MYRKRTELAVNILNITDRMSYYQENVYDNIYFIDKDNNFLGYLNYKLELAGNQSFCTEYVAQEASSKEILAWFKSHPGIFRIPLVKNGSLVGEYYDSDANGACLYYRIELMAKKILPHFRMQVGDYLRNKRIGVIGSDEEIRPIRIVTDTFFRCDYNSVNEYDLILDCHFSRHIRQSLSKDAPQIICPSQLIIPIFIGELSKYLQYRNIKFIALDGIMSSELRLKYPSEQLDLTLEEAICDDNLVTRFCGSDTLSFSYIKSHQSDLNQISRIIYNGIHNCLLDVATDDFNIINGMRFTTDVPDNPKREVHIFGPCVVEGLCVVDSKTIPSILQRMINAQDGIVTEVINHGLAYGKDILNDLLCIAATPLRKGDIVVWISGFSEAEEKILIDNNLSVIDCKWFADILRNWYLDNPFHCNADTNVMYAEEIFRNIQNNITTFDQDDGKTCFIEDIGLPLAYDPDAILESNELKKYVNYLSRNKFDSPNERIGCIIINANPFTKGHQYLIEESLKVVELLYVFLVEESKGPFSYIDREYMVKEYCKNNQRIKVLSGGNIMTSTIGFPEYFNRTVDHKNINPLLNHKIFAIKVAPVLGIKMRFFGDEPNDKVTQALNTSARTYLPQYGIEVRIIKRLEINGTSVSAKTVRDLYFKKNHTALKPLVPLSTYTYLLQLES